MKKTSIQRMNRVTGERMKDEEDENQKDEQGKKRDLRERTKSYALRIIRLYISLPKTAEAQLLGRQLLKSGTSPGAHYREAQRAKSDLDFISKIEGGLQELEESGYWLELLGETRIISEERLKPLQDETEELISIFTKMVINVKNKRQKR